jgi:glycosyltransferase involved in cell wall biosynthesis
VDNLEANRLPKITIITPSYNQGAFIEETILSVINQDYSNLEYIIIDGGSTDNTVDIIKKYSDRMSYWVSEKDNGQSHAINKGLRKATGEIVNWINSDDQLMPGALLTIARCFIDNPTAIMVHGRIEYFGETTNYYSVNMPEKDIEIRYAAHICMPQPACFFRRKLIEQQGYLDESLHFSMDTDLFLRAGLHYAIVQIEDVISRFRLHGTSKSVSSFNRLFLSDNQKIFSRVLATLEAHKAIAEMKQLNLYEEPSYLYNRTQKKFDTGKLVFYFLYHRLLTLYFHGERNEFRRIFSHLIKHHTRLLLSVRKLLLYRTFIFLPRGFFHALARFRYRSTNKSKS